MALRLGNIDSFCLSSLRLWNRHFQDSILELGLALPHSRGHVLKVLDVLRLALDFKVPIDDLSTDLFLWDSWKIGVNSNRVTGIPDIHSTDDSNPFFVRMDLVLHTLEKRTRSPSNRGA